MLRGRLLCVTSGIAALVLAAWSVTVTGQRSGDWPLYGRDAGAQRFSPLTQITPQNVATLTRAWTFDTGATAMQVTPLVIDGVMYVTAGANIFALEPETAKVLWKFSHDGHVAARPGLLARRRARPARGSIPARATAG